MTLRVLTSGQELAQHHLVPVDTFGKVRGGLRCGVLSPRYAGTLSEFCDNFVCGADDAAVLLAQVAEAIEYLHSVGLIHCDVKPSNVFLDNSRNSFLGDFGSLRHLDDTIESYTPAFRIADFWGVLGAKATKQHDWGSFVILGLVLLRKLHLSTSSPTLIEVAPVIDALRDDTSAACVILVKCWDEKVYLA